MVKPSLVSQIDHSYLGCKPASITSTDNSISMLWHTVHDVKGEYIREYVCGMWSSGTEPHSLNWKFFLKCWLQYLSHFTSLMFGSNSKICSTWTLWKQYLKLTSINRAGRDQAHLLICKGYSYVLVYLFQKNGHCHNILISAFYYTNTIIAENDEMRVQKIHAWAMKTGSCAFTWKQMPHLIYDFRNRFFFSTFPSHIIIITFPWLDM